MAREGFKHFDEVDFAFRNSKGKVKPAPDLPAGAPVADTHCHLGMLKDAALAIARAAHHGVRFLCCVNDPGDLEPDDGELSAVATYEALDGWLAQARGLLDGWGEQGTPLPQVRMACGVHPHNARHWDAAAGELLALLDDERSTCIGEIGLDYHYDFSPRPVQRDVFAAQLQLAHERHMPVELHLREAHTDALDILYAEGVPQAGCVVHCFNLDADTLAPFLELGCYISLGGPLTFKKSWYTRRAVLDVPPERLLTETDAPFMAPEPVRGTECDPAQTVYTLRMLLDCFGFAGAERAGELTRPRPADIASGAAPADAAQAGVPAADFDEAGFAERVYRNAVEVLGEKHAR